MLGLVEREGLIIFSSTKVHKVHKNLALRKPCFRPFCEVFESF